MIKFLYNLNVRYTKIPEPKRFFVFLALALPGIIMSTMNLPGDTVGWIGFVYLLVLLAFRASFIYGWLDGGKE